MAPFRNRKTKGVKTPASPIQNPPPYSIAVVPSTSQEGVSLPNGLSTFHLFSELPKELQLAIMKLWLVRQGPIVNPFKPHRSYQPTEWIDDINFTVLRTCKEFHKEGTDLFYKHNVFLFAQVKTSSRESVILSRTGGFLLSTIHYFEPGSPPQEIGIGALVKNVAFADSEKKSGPVAPSQPPDFGSNLALWKGMLHGYIVASDFSCLNLTVDALDSLTIHLDIREPGFGKALQGHLEKAKAVRARMWRDEGRDRDVHPHETVVEKLIIRRTSPCRGVQPDDASTELIRRLLALNCLNVRHIRYEN